MRQHQLQPQAATPAQLHQPPIAKLSPHPVPQLQAALGNRAINRAIAVQRPPRSNPASHPIQAKLKFQGLSHELADHPLPDSVLKPTERPGKQMPPAVQQKMEASFETDFSDVQIHEGAEADAIGAIAYTRGNHIHFTAGQYNPWSQSGQQLLGHELTHVLQQRTGKVGKSSAETTEINADPDLEREADRYGTRAAQSQEFQAAEIRDSNAGATPHSGGVIQCAGFRSRLSRPSRPFRRWLGKIGGPAIGKAGREGRAARVQDLMDQINSTQDDINTGRENQESNYRFTEEQLETHWLAYQKARFYHTTRTEHVERIMEGGLQGGAAEGASATLAQGTGRDFVYLGGDQTTMLFYEGIYKGKGIPSTALRVFLTKGQHDTDLNPDHEHRDGNAFIGPKTIAAKQILKGTMAENERETLRPIFEIVKEYYPDDDQPDVDEVIARHFEAIERGITKHEPYAPSHKLNGTVLGGRDDRLSI